MDIINFSNLRKASELSIAKYVIAYFQMIIRKQKVLIVIKVLINRILLGEVKVN